VVDLPRPLVLLPYYERPGLVLNALESLRRQGNSWDMAFIDDGSRHHGRPIVERALAHHLDHIQFYRTEDSIEDKVRQGGSRIGQIMNDAVKASNADIVVILCDDDALVEGYLDALSVWYAQHPGQPWSYCHVVVWDPTQGSVPWGAEVTRDHPLNAKVGPLFPSSVLDSSQVTFRRECFDVSSFPSIAPKNHDAAIFDTVSRLFGPCHFNGLRGQYKAFFHDQLGARAPAHPDSIYHVSVP
jgi:hypothetical protein